MPLPLNTMLNEGPAQHKVITEDNKWFHCVKRAGGNNLTVVNSDCISIMYISLKKVFIFFKKAENIQNLTGQETERPVPFNPALNHGRQIRWPPEVPSYPSHSGLLPHSVNRQVDQANTETICQLFLFQESSLSFGTSSLFCLDIQPYHPKSHVCRQTSCPRRD